MQKTISSLLFISIILVSTCSKKDDPGLPAFTGCRLSSITAPNQIEKVIYASSGLVDTISFTYLGNEYRASMTYDGQGHLLDIHDPHQHTQFQTGSNGLPSIATVHLSDVAGQDSLLLTTIKYTYTTDKLIDTVRYNSFTYSRYEFDASGNLSKVFAASQKPESLVSEYSDYDDKISFNKTFPFLANFYSTSVPPTTYMTVNFDPVRRVHNYRTSTFYDSNGAPSTFSTTFTYNSDDYPVTATMGSIVAQLQYECK